MDKSGGQLPSTSVGGRLRLPLERPWRTACILMQWLKNWSFKCWRMMVKPYCVIYEQYAACCTWISDANMWYMVMTIKMPSSLPSAIHIISDIWSLLSCLYQRRSGPVVFCSLTLLYRLGYGSTQDGLVTTGPEWSPLDNVKLPLHREYIISIVNFFWLSP